MSDELVEAPGGFVRAIHDALCPLRNPHGMCEWPSDRGATVYDAANAAWNSDLLAARERAAAEKALLDAIHRIEVIAMPTVEIAAARETDLFVLRDLLRIARGDA